MTSCCSYNPTYCSCWCCFYDLLLCSVWFRCVVLTTCCSYSPTYCSCWCGFFLCDLLLCSVWFRYVVLTTCCSYTTLTAVVDVTVLPSFVLVRRVTPRSGGVLCCPAEVVRQSTVGEVLSVVGVPVGVLGVPALTGKQAVGHWLGPHVTPRPPIVKTVVVYKIQS